MKGKIKMPSTIKMSMETIATKLSMLKAIMFQLVNWNIFSNYIHSLNQKKREILFLVALKERHCLKIETLKSGYSN